MGYKEELTELVREYTEDKIDITDNWNEWEEFLSNEKIIQNYDEICEMELHYCVNNQALEFYDEENNKWDIEKAIKEDNDIHKMSNGCYFVHYQEYIDEWIIDLFYEQQEEKAKQERLNWAINQAYIDLDQSDNGFSRFDALLFIFGHDFGEQKIFFASSIDKVRKELLKCIQDVLEVINDAIDDGSIKLWLPNHDIWSDEEDEHYCELLKFGGYEILEDGKTILTSDAILLKDEKSIHTLDYFTYQNMNHLCDYIAEVFESYKTDCLDIGGKVCEQETNQKLNEIIDNYWKNGKIDFDYAEFLQQ